MNRKKFKAMVVSRAGGNAVVRTVGMRSVDDLPAGDVLIRVLYSSLNYKDALSASGNRGVTKHYPHTPGIDAAGIVEESESDLFRPQDAVLVTGYDLGMNTPGGFGEYIRVPAAWVVPLPADLSARESMVYGTAGFTAALSVSRLQQHGVMPEQGEILVTGATGGVGSMAVAMLAREGFHIAAATGKEDAKAYLMDLGATAVISRSATVDTSGRPLLKGRWAGVIDTVGGDILATAIKSTRYGGAVTCCGNVAAPELSITVYPFILRGVSLLGIDSANCPYATRVRVWQKIATDWKFDRLERLATEVRLEELDGCIEQMLAGKIRGRIIINLTS